MKTVTLTAHFDGEQIRLDEPFPLSSDTQLLVTILPPKATDADRDAWTQLSISNLARAYTDDEPDYTAF